MGVRGSGSNLIPVVDLFAGPGGLSEGFSQFASNGKAVFDVVLSIEKEASAHETLRLRSLYRKLVRAGDNLKNYYDVLKRGGGWNSFSLLYPDLAQQAETEAWCAELGKTAPEEVDARIGAALNGCASWVLIGGPPCQAYSLVGRSRRKTIKGYRPDKDERTLLYREYLKIIAKRWPTIFVMENVKGLLSHKVLEEKIFDQIREDLQDPAKATGSTRRSPKYQYRILSLLCPSDVSITDPFKFVVQAEHFGVPQARHRVILLGIRSDLSNSFPTPLVPRGPVSCSKVFEGLPPLRSGLSKEKDSAEDWLAAVRSACKQQWFKQLNGSAVAKRIREVVKGLNIYEHDRGATYVENAVSINYQKDWYLRNHPECVLNHQTRGHIVSDLHRYLFASCFAEENSKSPKLEDFPKGLLPRHENVNGNLAEVPFGDRFRVQVADRPATTVTSHISKDGHYYIHPDPSQCRSLTVREAARLQTFPDSYFFTGNRTSQYVQVGNAVPPLLARSIAQKVHEVLGPRRRK
jgi:DNA (cytosine-5)-methyltransferase 1